MEISFITTRTNISPYPGSICGREKRVTAVKTYTNSNTAVTIISRSKCWGVFLTEVFFVGNWREAIIWSVNKLQSDHQHLRRDYSPDSWVLSNKKYSWESHDAGNVPSCSQATDDQLKDWDETQFECCTGSYQHYPLHGEGEHGVGGEEENLLVSREVHITDWV